MGTLYSKTKRQKLDKLFSRLLCSCIGCLQSNRPEIIHALAGINELSYTHEYFRMLFKYLISDERNAVDSFHMNLMESIEDSHTEYAKWCRRESADEVKCGYTDGDKPVPRFEIKGVLNTRRFNTVVKKYKGEENISIIDKNTILNKNRCYGNTSWLIRKWLSPRQFITLCNTLGGGEKMLYSKYCFRCGCENSVEHCLKECTLIKNKETDSVDLEALFESKEKCQKEMIRLEKMVKRYRKSTMLVDCSFKKITVFYEDEQKDFIAIAPTRQDRNVYRCLPLDGSNFAVQRNLKDIHKYGKLYVHRGNIDLSEYIVD